MTKDKQAQLPKASPKTIFLVDGSGYIYRAFHAIRGLRNSKGFPTNAVYGFTRMLMKLLEEKHFQSIVMFFDSKGPTFRHEIYKDYKANRPPMPEDLSVQIPYIRKITNAFNIPAIAMPGYEADDLIATAAGLAEKEGYSVVIVTGDKDLKQLITEKSIIWDPMKDKTIRLKTIEESGIKPSQLSDVMGLSGDASDNIPGVPGIGPKTALKLIQMFESMDKLYQHVDEIPQRKQRENLIQFKEQALLSKKLVILDDHAPLEIIFDEFNVQPPDPSALSTLFKELEFRQLQRLFPQKTDLSKKTYKGIQDLDALQNLVKKLSHADLMAVDTETTSTNPMLAELVGLSFSISPDEAFYIPCAHQ